MNQLMDKFKNTLEAHFNQVSVNHHLHYSEVNYLPLNSNCICMFIFFSIFSQKTDKQDILPEDPASDLNFEETAIDNLCYERADV